MGGIATFARRAAVMLVLGCGALPAAAQETLADLRQQLAVLQVELQRLNRELVTTGAPTTGLAGTSIPERVDLMERELQRLTAKTEELQFRIERIVADGTNRIGDLTFRLCELDPDCDIASLGDTPTLGGGAAPRAPATPVPDTTTATTTELAVGEQADFDAARAAHDAGDYARAAELFQAFTDTYTGGPLTGEAHFRRGQALEALGRTADAARAYLESFSGSPDGPAAPGALLRLGLMLDKLGQRAEACVTLSEVPTRYPGSQAAAEAAAARGRMSCQ